MPNDSASKDKPRMNWDGGKIGSSALWIAYPATMWVGITILGTRAAGWGVLAALAVLVAVDLGWNPERRQTKVVLLRLALAAFVGLGILLDEERFFLLMPVMVNVSLLVVFGRSLFGGRVTMVERFARAWGDDLTERHIAYYRKVTVVWCWFFVGNGLVILWLALFGSLAAWGIYTGMIAYLLVGALFGSEYIVRKLRFG